VHAGRLGAVFRKELRDYRRNKFIAVTMLALPLFFLVIPISQVLALKSTTPALAVIVSAIVDALKDHGVRDIQMPATPYAIWQAIQNAKAKRGHPPPSGKG